jgi:hypothetical protein
MKKITLLFLAFSMAAFVSSCKKDDDNTSTPTNTGGNGPTKTEILSGRTWKITGATLDGQSIFDIFDDCDKDNIYQWKTNGDYVVDEGATKCDPNDPQIETQDKWKFTDNETKLEFDGEVSEIKELTVTKLVLEGDFQGKKATNTFEAR